MFLLPRLPKLCRIIDVLKTFNRSTSALYITGEKAFETFAVLTPHLDFEERLKNKQELIDNIKLRGVDLNLDEVIRMWNFYKHVESKKNDLEDSRASISQTITHLAKKGDRYAEKINTLKAHGKMVKEDLRILKESFWSVEEKAAIKILSLPNILHPKTPISNPTVIHSHLECTNLNSESHLDLGKKLDLIEYNSPDNYYLKNNAALFELSSTFYLTDQLLNKNYLQFSNSDFARSVIVEGCGLNFSDPNIIFTINEADKENKHESSRLHLTGGASLSAFMAYFCRHTIFPTLFPLKYFAVGRKYQPVTSSNASLFNISQETAVNIFVATQDDTHEMMVEFEKVLKDVIDIYESLNYHFRVCYVPVKELHNWESLRASIQMFSSHLNKYIEVGNISLCGNYVSKRLQFNYGKGYNMYYPCIITGTILSSPKLLACVLESTDSKNPLLPNIFKHYVNL